MDIYREEILENWQNPQNFGKIKGANRIVREINPLCGDRVTFYFKIKNGKIADVSFEGGGCAISIAAASILSGRIKGERIQSVWGLKGDTVLEMIGANADFPPARLKCAFLALEAVKKLKTNE